MAQTGGVIILASGFNHFTGRKFYGSAPFVHRRAVQGVPGSVLTLLKEHKHAGEF